jgi:superfamily II DNA or RNA helicase
VSADLVRHEFARGAQVLVWTVFNEETAILARELADVGGLEVLSGSTPKAERPDVIDRFRRGATRVLIAKARMLGYGMNLQQCTAMVFSGWTDSFEDLYQAVRRAVRHGQTEAVRVYFPVVRELEGDTLDNIHRKAAEFEPRRSAEMEDDQLRRAGSR